MRLTARDVDVLRGFVGSPAWIIKDEYQPTHKSNCECKCNEPPKPTDNELTVKATKEVEYANNKALELLRAVDQIKDKRITSVSYGPGYVTVIFETPNEDADAKKRTQVSDATSHDAMNQVREMVCTKIADLLQTAGRAMLVLVAQAQARVVGPELAAVKAQQMRAETAAAKDMAHNAEKAAEMSKASLNS